MEPAQKNGTRPPAGGYYTSTGRQVADFLIGFVWAPLLYLILAGVYSYSREMHYILGIIITAGWLCLLILLWRFFSRRGRRFALSGIALALIIGILQLIWMLIWTGLMIHLGEWPHKPKPISFDRQVWLNPGRARQARYAMLNDLLLKHRLVGMTRSEAEQLLGKPSGGTWYTLKIQGLGFGEKRLELRYKDEKVSGFSIVDE